FNDGGGAAEVFVACFANVAHLIRVINSRKHDRLFVFCGGFYGTPSLEDAIVLGDIIRGTMSSPLSCDDEARMMLASAAYFAQSEDRILNLQTNWIGRALKLFGMADDIPAIVRGDAIDDAIRW